MSKIDILSYDLMPFLEKIKNSIKDESLKQQATEIIEALEKERYDYEAWLDEQAKLSEFNRMIEKGLKVY